MGKRRGKTGEPAAGDEAAAPRGPSLKKTKREDAARKSKKKGATHGDEPMQYGVLKGRAVKGKRAHKHAQHYELTVKAEREGDASATWQVPLDVRSAEGSLVMFFADENVTAQAPERADLRARWATKLEALAELAGGWTPLEETAALALDYVRDGYVHADEMTRLGADGTSDGDDVNDEVHFWVKRAIEQRAEVFVFGSRFGGAKRHGVHDVHMNQGNDGASRRDNGARRDGGLVLRFSSGKTAALLFAFASQSRDVDDRGDPR
jgi:uncharacterized protein YukJ